MDFSTVTQVHYFFEAFVLYLSIYIFYYSILCEQKMSFLCLKTLVTSYFAGYGVHHSQRRVFLILLFYWKLDFFFKLILMIEKKLNIGSNNWSTLIINVVKHTLKAYMCMYI